MTRASALTGLAVLLGVHGHAQAGPVAAFNAFEYVVGDPAESSDDGPIFIAASPEPLWGAGNPAMDGRQVLHNSFSTSTVLDYSDLHDGDVAGLAIRLDGQRWISIQVERITPADLIAVRRRSAASDPLAGKLLATTALGGGGSIPVRLRIDGNEGRYTLMFASGDAAWQVLADNVDGTMMEPLGANGAIVGPFATDGAER